MDKGSKPPNRGASESSSKLSAKMRLELISDICDLSLNYLSPDFNMYYGDLDFGREEAELPSEAPELEPPEEAESSPFAQESCSDVLEYPADYKVDFNYLQNILAAEADVRTEPEEFCSDELPKESLYYSSFHSIDVPLLFITPHTLKIKDVNSAGARLLGIWGNEIKGKSLRSIMTREIHTTIDAFVVSMLLEEPCEIEMEIRIREDKLIRLVITGTAVRQRSKLIGFLLQLSSPEPVKKNKPKYTA